MTDDAPFALSRIERGEDLRTEFLSTPDEKELAKTVCAFLNTEGGVVIIGVEKDGTVAGTGLTKKTARQLELSLKETITPLPLVAVSLQKIDGKTVALVDTPQGTDRPYVAAGGVWLRESARTRAADADALRALLKRQVETPRWERRLSQATIEDLDHKEVLAVARNATEDQRYTFTDPDDEMAIMDNLALGSGGAVTQGGDVLFGAAPWRRFPQCRVQWVEFETDKIGDVYRNQAWLQGPMVRICRELFEKLDGVNKSRSVFSETNVQREDRASYSRRALREGIVNALVHRDFESYSGGVKVSVFPNRIEIWNAGRLPSGITTVDLKKDHPSILINPDITQAFYVASLMEALGRGTQKIAADCKALGAKAPTWKDAPTGVTLTIFAADAATEAKPFQPNPRQQKLLDTLAVGTSIDVASYRRRFASEVSDRQARRDLTELADVGRMKKEGSGTGTAYRRL